MISLSKQNKDIVIKKLLKKHKKLPNGCWEWTGKTYGGYGFIKAGYHQDRAHRWSMRLLRPDDYNDLLLVCHKCNNSRCINPSHLYMGSRKDNTRDSIKAGTCTLVNKFANRNKCSKGHEYTIENTYVDPSGYRQCKECRRIRGMIYNLYH
jgi:hypothetical protein